MTTESNKEYSVNWKNHMSHVRKAFDHLLNTNELTDVTLYCDGRKIGAHKMLLSACSTYFRDVFKEVPCQHPVIIMQGIEYGVLSDILHFIYNGEVSVDTAKLDAFLKSAQMLQISGLTDGVSDKDEAAAEETANEEETFIEPIAPAISINDNARKVAKRSKTDDASAQNNKRQREEDEPVFVSDVKCEPSELVNFEDPLEDPLVQNEQAGTQNIPDEDYKQQQTKNSWPISTVKCNICEKVFSHPYSLQQHKPVHAGNTRCPICNAVLSRKYHLKLHMKARHNLN